MVCVAPPPFLLIMPISSFIYTRCMVGGLTLCPYLHGNNNFATIVNALSVLKLFQLSNGDFINFVASLQHLKTRCSLVILFTPNLRHLSELSANFPRRDAPCGSLMRQHVHCAYQKIAKKNLIHFCSSKGFNGNY